MNPNFCDTQVSLKMIHDSDTSKEQKGKSAFRKLAKIEKRINIFQSDARMREEQK